MEKVAFGITLPFYNNELPYHPYKNYPELPFSATSKTFNYPYDLLRKLFFEIGFDRDNFNTKQWNPFKELIKPGEKVVINPNFVISYHPLGKDLFSIITHPSILRVIVDYAFIALKGEGEIIIADAPQMDCNWNELMNALCIDSIQEFYQKEFNFVVKCIDLRNFELIDNRKKAYFENRRQLPGDPLGDAIINLGRNSEFYGLPSENYYGADLNRDVTIQHHNNETQEYCLSKTILTADTIIFVPKMKVHKKVGVTLNIKGLVGINTNKNYLIHYRVGTPSQGGDQLPDGQPKFDNLMIKAQRFLYDKALAKMSKTGDFIYKIALGGYNKFIKPFKKVSEDTLTVDSGNWHGNDSAWRMAADLAKILYFYDINGNKHNHQLRKMFCIVDGIIGGENVGPLLPDENYSGALVIGSNPFAGDIITTRLMGYDYKKIKQFNIIENENWNFGIRSHQDIQVYFNGDVIEGEQFFNSLTNKKIFAYKPHPGWIGTVEI